MKIAILSAVIVIMLLSQTAWPNGWQGIVPLRSTRADVERRFGKPDEWGGYDLKDERVSFNFVEAPCKGLYRDLGADNCKCLADDGAVMSIFVEPKVKRKASDLKLDVKVFQKTAISPFPHTFTYENQKEGIVYTVDELEDEIMHITYYPSQVDCKSIIAARAPRDRNSWRGLVPLHSNRKDVEALLGSHKPDGKILTGYETDYEKVVAKYSTGKCVVAGHDWNVPKDTLLELVINPTPSFLLKELAFDSSRYERREIFPYPEVDNPPRVWNYIDNINGLIIRTESSLRAKGEELVVSITYLPRQKDEKLLCR